MRQMSLGVNIFAASQVSSTKNKSMEKFGELFIEEILKIRENAVPVARKKP